MNMKIKTLMASSTTLLAMLAGCDQNHNDTPSPYSTNYPATNYPATNAVAGSMGESALDMSDTSYYSYNYSQRDQYVDRMRQDLDQLKSDLNSLENKVSQSSSTNKDEAKLKLQDMQNQIASIRQKLDASKDTTESGWSDFKEGMRKGYDSTKESLTHFRQWLSDKITP